MAPDERRRAIVEATLPLLLEHGTALSTRQIAQAAGIAEGTIFRAFETKQELLNEAILHALAVEKSTALLHAVDTARPLAEVVAELIGILQEEIGRTRALASLLSGPPSITEGKKCPAINPRERQAALHAAVCEALRAHADGLAVDPDTAASVLIAMAFATTHQLAGTHALTTPRDIAHVVLHGLAQGDS